MCYLKELFKNRADTLKKPTCIQEHVGIYDMENENKVNIIKKMWYQCQ